MFIGVERKEVITFCSQNFSQILRKNVLIIIFKDCFVLAATWEG